MGFTPRARDTVAWQRAYDKRTAVERVNSRLDRVLGFESRTIRGLKKWRRESASHSSFSLPWRLDASGSVRLIRCVLCSRRSADRPPERDRQVSSRQSGRLGGMARP